MTFIVKERYITKDGMEHDSILRAKTHAENRILAGLASAISSSKLSAKRIITQADAMSLALDMYEKREELREVLAFDTFGDDEELTS